MATTRLTLLPLLLLFCLWLPAQKGERRFQGRYAEDLAAGEKEVFTTYQHMLSSKPGGGFILRTYFPETRQLVAYAEYTDRKLKNRQGPARYWYEEGGLREEGVYINDTWHGDYVAYYRSGQKSQEGAYQVGKRTGSWRSYHEDGTVSMEQTYQNGLLDGPTVLVDSLGPRDSLFYRAGVQINGEGEDVELDERMPMFSGCGGLSEYRQQKRCADRLMLEWIYANIRYPERARELGVEGMAIVQFVIDKEGYVTDVQSIYGLNEDVRDEITDLVSHMPRWEPGMQNGKYVNVVFNLPIKFSL